MNKADLISAVSAGTGETKKVIADVVDATLAEVSSALAHGESVRLSGFGTFEVRERAARTARNPRTGEPVPLPARRAPTFRPSPALRESVEQT